MRAEIKNELGQVMGVLGLENKTFKTGSIGYHGTGKVYIDGKKYQANVLLVKVKSKGKSKD